MKLPRLFKSPQSLRGGYVYEQVAQWFRTPAGQSLLTAEESLCEQVVAEMFGYHIVQLGVGARGNLCKGSSIRHQVHVVEKACASTDLAAAQFAENASSACNPPFGETRPPLSILVSSLEELAIANDSVDVVILHHCLDFTLQPQRILREVSRVVIPGGKIVIVGFNPWSLWGIWRMMRSHLAEVPWCGSFLSPYRVSDWLGVLDLHVEGYESTHFGLPVGENRWVGFNRWMGYFGTRWWRHVGASYVMVATKQVSRITPVRPPIPAVKPSLVAIPLKTLPASRNIANKQQDRDERN
ncbi:Hypothetical protein HDN1F_16660 [gamma proteobacterium HdN1]|nr:Hypothetical protein HDN1F_16660 [gamma proteobacterium HdN1]